MNGQPWSDENRLTIHTPDGIVFSYQLAGPMSRLLALLVDLACISTLLTMIGSAFFWLRILSRDLNMAILLLAGLIVTLGYSIALEWRWRGQTIGKRLLSLRVIDVEGRKLTPQQVILRNLLRTFDQLPASYLVGGAVMLLNRKSQRLGDWAANTVVIRIPTLVEPDLSLVTPPKFNSLLVYPHLAARLAQRASPREAWLALEATRRRDRVVPGDRLVLFAQLATHFKEMVEFPPEACEGISDEQFVRNVAGVLFRKTRSAK